MKKFEKTAKKSQKTKTFFGKIKAQKIKYLILWLLVKGLYFQYLLTKIFEPKIL